MRSKEKAHDYRYFPEPDLLPVHVSPAWRDEVLRALPELPPPSAPASLPPTGSRRMTPKFLRFADLADYSKRS